MISIVTATYNRENLLPNLYDSLIENKKSYKDFEWVIMDDGSTDNTEDLVRKWIKENKIDIKYFKQKNQGKMSAINNAMPKISGEIVMEVDSDDTIVKDGLKMVATDYENLSEENIYGILYKRILGKKNTEVKNEMDNKVITLFDIHNKYGFDFDMNLTFKSDIRKKYKYKLINNEKFVTEASLYYKLDQLYDGMLFKDKYLVAGEYQEDGYSKNISGIFKKYPFGYHEYFKNCLTYIKKDTNKKRKLYFIKHYILFSYLTKKSIFKCIKEAPKYKILISLLVIPGYIKSSLLK